MGASCICVMIALLWNGNSSVNLQIYLCIFCNALQEFIYSDFLHILFEDPNFGNHSPSNYKILDKPPMISESQVKQPKVEAIYSQVYIY